MTDFLTGDLTVPHGFFTRAGGVSRGTYASLNCGLSGMDNLDHVAENRARAARAIGAAPSQLLGIKQVHGSRVITATAPWAAGSGPEADAMVTDQPNLALGIITADCAPILLADATKRVIGAVHAGWRGALVGVLEATIVAMRNLGGEDITAVVGPCIRQPSYEVGPDLHDAIVAHDNANDRFFSATGRDHWQFDLPGYVAARLKFCGVRVACLPHDTYANETQFFSHRRRTRRGEGAGGHQISIIMSA
ncbi:MAG: peptidoglycan editing factor PgeF [Acidiphilium sp.]|nr:peptidoglycan editing factor PgeF [Acidiphilium sp.]MDD4934942.1 peptidoglycan editing factor PgeF [Acidiphilium sp.]